MFVLFTAGFRWSRPFAIAPGPRNDRNRSVAIAIAKHLRLLPVRQFLTPPPRVAGLFPLAPRAGEGEQEGLVYAAEVRRALSGLKGGTSSPRPSPPDEERELHAFVVAVKSCAAVRWGARFSLELGGKFC